MLLVTCTRDSHTSEFMAARNHYAEPTYLIEIFRCYTVITTSKEESEEEPRFVNVRLVIVVIIQSISFDIHQNKFSACVLNLLLEYH